MACINPHRGTAVFADPRVAATKIHSWQLPLSAGVSSASTRFEEGIHRRSDFFHFIEKKQVFPSVKPIALCNKRFWNARPFWGGGAESVPMWNQGAANVQIGNEAKMISSDRAADGEMEWPESSLASILTTQ
jgi:hypothetical protein